MKHYCGIIGIVDNLADKYLINGLELQQHRGHDSAGISYLNRITRKITTYKRLGYVKNIFKDYEFTEPFNMAIGHVRYSTRKKTTTENKLREAQPFYEKSNFGTFALAHNGNIPNISKFKQKYNVNTITESDSEILAKIISQLTYTYKTWNDVLIHFINAVKGAYCILLITDNCIYGLRDVYGVRPICMGKRENGGYCIASESIALQDYKYCRDIEPGEIVKITEKYKLSTIYKKIHKTSFCSFEIIYFFRHKSLFNGECVEKYRYDTGYELGRMEKDILGDIVVCVPETAIAGAEGFAAAINIPFKIDYIQKSNKVNRTFILSSNEERKKACDNKFIYDCSGLEGKNVYIVDDSIVRGNTLESVIGKLKDIGVKQIHVRIVSPKIISECYYGIDMSTKDELIGYNKSEGKIASLVGADTLKYLDVNKIEEIFGTPLYSLCTSCFTGKYDSKLLDW